MKKYDVVIVDAGPAGCQCARRLADNSKKILLVEKVSNFDDNDFSSAGAPLEILKRFKLPDSLVGTYWNKISIFTTRQHHTWKSEKDLGVVLDFTKLKKFLIQEAERKNCEVLLGHKYIKYSRKDQDYIITFEKEKGSKRYKILSRIVVEATGPTRAVMQPENKNFLVGIGLEYLIQITKNKSKYLPHDALQFFLGYKWMPHGYG